MSTAYLQSFFLRNGYANLFLCCSWLHDKGLKGENAVVL